jgi:hypothetical protein
VVADLLRGLVCGAAAVAMIMFHFYVSLSSENSTASTAVPLAFGPAWRRRLSDKGNIGVFNRSHYEDALVVWVLKNRNIRFRDVYLKGLKEADFYCRREMEIFSREPR